MSVGKWGLSVVSAGLIAAVVINWPGNAGDATNVPAPLPVAPARAASPTVTASERPALPMPSGDVSLSKQVQELVETHDPQKLFVAYWLLADCVEFNRDHDRLIFDPELLKKKPNADNVTGLRHMTEQEKQQDTKRCGAMTERERQSRLEYLAAAAKAGVAGSAVAFLREGPFGDPTALTTRPDDPLVKEWKALAKAQLTAEADAGTDPGAVNYIAVEYAGGSAAFEQNPRLAYRYFLANGLIQGELLGPDADVARFFAEDGDLMASMGKDLSPAERAAESAAARQIALNFRKRRALVN